MGWDREYGDGKGNMKKGNIGMGENIFDCLNNLQHMCHSSDQEYLIDLRCLHAGVIECFIANVNSVPNERGSKRLKLRVHELLIDVLRSTGTR
jgi:hypothetical protein